MWSLAAAVARVSCSHARAQRRSGRPASSAKASTANRACSLAAPVVLRRWTALAKRTSAASVATFSGRVIARCDPPAGVPFNTRRFRVWGCGLLPLQKKEMDTLTLLRISQLQLNDIMSSPTLRYSVLLRLKACGQSVECLQ